MADDPEQNGKKTAETRIPKGPVAEVRLVAVDAVYGQGGQNFLTDDGLSSMLLDSQRQLEERLDRVASDLIGDGLRVDIISIRPIASVQLLIRITAMRPLAVTRPLSELISGLATAMQQVIVGTLQSAFGVFATIYEDWDVLVPDAETGDGGAKQPWDRIAPVLAAIATGIGVLGFVAFVGGAVEYARLNAAGLPAEQALAVVPKANLVVVGAETLVPALVAAVAFVLLLVVWVIYAERKGTRHPTDLRVLPKESGEGRTKQTPFKRAVTVVGLMAVVEVLAFGIGFGGRGPWEFIILFILGPATLAVMYHITLARRELVWLLASAFLLMSTFLSGIAYARATDDKDVRPAAVVRSNDKAIVGFMIAQTPDRIYLGRLDLNREGHIRSNRSRILVLRDDQITDISVGPPMNADDALARAKQLADELCSHEITRGQRAGAGATSAQSAASTKDSTDAQDDANERNVKKTAPKGTPSKEPTKSSTVPDCWSLPAGERVAGD
jgi:hypothetical protein